MLNMRIWFDTCIFERDRGEIIRKKHLKPSGTLIKQNFFKFVFFQKIPYLMCKKPMGALINHCFNLAVIKGRKVIFFYFQDFL